MGVNDVDVFLTYSDISQDIQITVMNQISEFLVSLGVPAAGCQLSVPVKFLVVKAVP